ncbi:uncharacterized protein LOC110032709 isoform X2 [Phalaenopsis equestris]|uniref:uncharacterized protein LOC110032709 isoform X2 n=1 Tax=Phalaenopsis equestris TaxID=78828 RepID=UPI0009E291E6|nr:uncharacterized protein LOC110032709 isoform X2 [Phalaenopsis equestris]
MSGMEPASRLCVLISGHLIPYLVPNTACLTKETERDLLLSLTEVRREIQRWMSTSISKPENIGEGSHLSHYCHKSLQQTFVGEQGCLYNIVSAMLAFLSADSQFVRHVAGNILLSISDFLIKHECLWAKLLRLIWFILEDAMSAIFSHPELSAPAVIQLDDKLLPDEQNLGDITEDQNLQSARFLALLKSRLFNVNQFIVLHLFQTLRNILKSLKHDFVELEEVFIQCAVSSLIKMPWDMLFEVFNCCYRSQISFQRVDESDIRSSYIAMKNLLFGTILQLYCSIIEVYDFEADGTSPFKEFSVYSKFSDLLPKLLSCCFINYLGNSRESLFEYLRHKLLITMIRLSSHSHWKNTCPESWLKLLNQFFGEILHGSFSGCDAGFENCLRESPFLSHFVKGDKFYSRHLQRQTIFLLFKFSFTIACVGEISKECSFEEEITSSGLKHCRNPCHFGLLEISVWLKRWCPMDKFHNCRNYSGSCSYFATSFLQLYMEEDDLLFKMLLLLLDAPFFTWQKEDSEKHGSIGANKDILCHFSSIFCPIRLFHLFLLLLHYDHSVLVDYLISKDVGIQCLHYLLRCLRLIYKSWPAFMQFSLLGNESDYRYHKRRKIPPDEDESPTLLSSTTAFQGQIMWRLKYFQCVYEAGDLHAFEKAKGCLHSLRISLGELQNKSLFPYDCKPLLKRKIIA